jgi:hypothetical protein
VCMFVYVRARPRVDVLTELYKTTRHAVLTTSDIALVGLGSTVTIGNIANVDSDWLCWKTALAGAATPVVVTECPVSAGSATAFGSAGTTVTCSPAVGGTTFDIVVDNHRGISIIACSGEDVGTSAVLPFEVTPPVAGGHSL